jgi:hypothetical protein
MTCVYIAFSATFSLVNEVSNFGPEYIVYKDILEIIHSDPNIQFQLQPLELGFMDQYAAANIADKFNFTELDSQLIVKYIVQHNITNESFTILFSTAAGIIEPQ